MAVLISRLPDLTVALAAAPLWCYRRYCLDAQGSTTKVRHYDCYPHGNQKWHYNESTKQIVAERLGACLQAPSAEALTADPLVRVGQGACDPSNPLQQYEMTAVHPVGEPEEFSICKLEERVDGDLRVVPQVGADAAICALSDSASGGNPWIYASNPAIAFSSPDPDITQVFPASQLGLSSVWHVGDIQAGERVVAAKQPQGCNARSKAGKSFLGVDHGDGGPVVYYMHDRRMSWRENTVDAPANVHSDETVSGRPGICPVVPRTIINEKSCVRRPVGQCVMPSFEKTDMVLDHDTLRKFYTSSSKMVLRVQGLRLSPGSEGYWGPCAIGRNSRWLRTAETGGCPADAEMQPDADTAKVIRAALEGVKRTLENHGVPVNPMVREVFAYQWMSAELGVTACADEAENIGKSVELSPGGECWLHVHPHEYNVYDFSAWALLHPGNDDALKARRRNPILKWAEAGLSHIEFPGWHDVVTRWQESVKHAKKFPGGAIGISGNTVDFAKLPRSVLARSFCFCSVLCFGTSHHKGIAKVPRTMPLVCEVRAIARIPGPALIPNVPGLQEPTNSGHGSRARCPNCLRGRWL